MPYKLGGNLGNDCIAAALQQHGSTRHFASEWKRANGVHDYFFFRLARIAERIPQSAHSTGKPINQRLKNGFSDRDAPDFAVPAGDELVAGPGAVSTTAARFGVKSSRVCGLNLLAIGVGQPASVTC